MPFVPANNVLQVELRGSYLGEEVENTLYFRHDTNINDFNVGSLFDYLRNTFLASVVVHQAQAFVWDELYATDLSTQTARTYERQFALPLAGFFAGDPLPGNVAFVISIRTANRGRSSRGRNYIGGFVDAQVAGNSLLIAHAQGLRDAYNDILVNAAFPSDWTWVVLSRVTGGLPRAQGLAQPVTGALFTDLVIDTQRGRLR